MCFRFAVLGQCNGDVERAVDALIMQASLDDSQFPDDFSSAYGGDIGADIDALTQTVLSRGVSTTSTRSHASLAATATGLQNDAHKSVQATYVAATGWACENCTFYNELATVKMCQMCGSERRGAATSQKQHRSAGPKQPLTLREIMDLEMAQKLSLEAAATQRTPKSNADSPSNSADVDWLAMGREVGTGSTSENRWQVGIRDVVAFE